MKIKYLFSLLSICLLLTAFVYLNIDRSTFEQAPDEIEEENLTNQEVYWSYEEENGPEAWMHVDSSYEACGKGEYQSPIDIEMSNATKQPEKDLTVKYTMTDFMLKNNGHAIQAYPSSNQNLLIFDGKEYEFIEMHFHSPSEHHLNGESFDMEAHLVHVNGQGELAVIGLFAKKGRENKILSDFWSTLPTKPEETVEVKTPINLEQLLPNDKGVFHYVGSLTTPPCTEGVQWFVLEQPIEMSEKQIKTISNIYPENNRPLQKLNNRQIEYLLLEKN